MTSSVDNSKNQSTSFIRETFLGGASAGSAAIVLKPLMYYKCMHQTQSLGNKFTFNPFVLYRGTGVFVASFVPIVAIQNAANSIFLPTLPPLLAAGGAGAVSALIVCPAEGILRQQEITGKNFKQTISDMHSSKGFRVFQRALTLTAIREGAFAGAYLGAVPAVKEKIKSMGFSDATAQLSAGITSGTAAAIISHPFDTYKTQVQSDLSKRVLVLGFFQRDAYLGLPARISMMATAATVMPFVKEKLSNLNSNEME